jgi:hypothetical protein
VVFEVITWAILGVCLAVWAIVGFIFWIPLLVRAAARFSVTLIQATFAGRDAHAAGELLRDAVNFYRRGFAVAIEAVGDRRFHVTQEAQEIKRRQPRRFVWELAWVVIIWYPILLWLGVIEGGPVGLFNWAVSQPWSEWTRSFFTGFYNFVDGLFVGFFDWLEGLGQGA